MMQDWLGERGLDRRTLDALWRNVAVRDMAREHAEQQGERGAAWGEGALHAIRTLSKHVLLLPALCMLAWASARSVSFLTVPPFVVIAVDACSAGAAGWHH